MNENKLKSYHVQAQVTIDLELKAEDSHDAKKKMLQWIEENNTLATTWDWSLETEGPMEEEALTESERIKEAAAELDKRYKSEF